MSGRHLQELQNHAHGRKASVCMPRRREFRAFRGHARARRSARLAGVSECLKGVPRCRGACREWDAVLRVVQGRNGAPQRRDYRRSRERRHGAATVDHANYLKNTCAKKELLTSRPDSVPRLQPLGVVSMAMKKRKTARKSHRRSRSKAARSASPMRKAARRVKRARKTARKTARKPARRAHKARRGARRSMKRR